MSTSNLPPRDPQDGPDSASPFARSKPVFISKPFQFDIVTILAWTAVIAVQASVLQGANINGLQEFASAMLFGAIFFAPASTCIPALVSRLKQENGHRIEGGSRVWFILLLGIYSMLSLMLATVGFEPEWKGSKGLHWFYYTLDKDVGMTLWPIYAIGIITLVLGIFQADRVVRKPIYLVVSATLSLISFWYVFAVLLLNFTATNANVSSASSNSSAKLFWVVPGSVGICYFLYAWLLLKNRQYSLRDVAKPFHLFNGWVGALVVSVGIKYPMAVRYYAALPDEPPDQCFIVTAASRGHRGVVGTWYDPCESRWLNQQLLTFWNFEFWLMRTLPRLHRAMRFIYNRIAPYIARTVVFRWQADLIYVLLKPLEWCAHQITREE